jgi:hypothetical protein
MITSTIKRHSNARCDPLSAKYVEESLGNLVDLAIEAHGGLKLWREIKEIELKLSMTGIMFRIKGYPEGLPNITMKIAAHEQRMSISPYPQPGQIGRFTPQRVWIEDAAGKIGGQLEDPLSSFAGYTATTPWNQLQLLYFFSYAFRYYLAMPFMLPESGFETRELEPHEENGEVWRRLHVKFPASVPTHSQEQVFYFNQAGLLQRLDYAPSTSGREVAHYCFDHQSFDGLMIPTLRRVVSRAPSGPQIHGPSLFLVVVTDAVVRK